RGRSIVPEVLEAGRRQLSIAHCVLDVAVAQIGLQRPGIDALIGELEAACVPQHVRMNREAEIGGNPKPRDHLTKPRGREGRPPFAGEDERRLRLLLALETAQGPQLSAGQWMDRLGAAFEPPDMQAAMGEVDGVPAQRHQLGRPQPVPVGDQDHGRITVAVTIPSGGGNQAGNLAVGEVLAGANLGVSFAARRVRAIANCPNNGGWRHQRQMRGSHDFLGGSSCYCPEYGRSPGTAQGEKRRFYKNKFYLSPAGKTVSTPEALNWGAFSVSGQPMLPQRWPGAMHNGGLRFTGEIFSEALAWACRQHHATMPLTGRQPAAAPFPSSHRRPSPPPKLA